MRLFSLISQELGINTDEDFILKVMTMKYIELAIAIGIVLLFACWSRYSRRRAERKKVKKAAKIYPLKRQTKLRRIK